ADRARLVLAAVAALLLGRVEHFAAAMTDDVAIIGPHVMVRSLAEAERVLGAPEVALSDAHVTLDRVYPGDGWLVAEWALTARVTGPVLYDDDILVEPTGGVARLEGVSLAS